MTRMKSDSAYRSCEPSTTPIVRMAPVKYDSAYDSYETSMGSADGSCQLETRMDSARGSYEPSNDSAYDSCEPCAYDPFEPGQCI